MAQTCCAQESTRRRAEIHAEEVQKKQEMDAAAGVAGGDAGAGEGQETPTTKASIYSIYYILYTVYYIPYTIYHILCSLYYIYYIVEYDA